MNAPFHIDNEHSKLNRLTVCADDFGLSRYVNAAVLELIDAGVVQATSALVGAPHWREAASDLIAHCAGHAQVGLHLDLTEFPLMLPRLPLPRLILRAYARRLDPTSLRDEIEAQLDAFETTAGRAPDYVDGHQHVHQLPVIRDQLVAAITSRYSLVRPWMRSTRSVHIPGSAAMLGVKRQTIALLGDRALGKLCQDAGIVRNRRLLGIYEFDSDAARYQTLLKGWIADAAPGDVLMCHPATEASQADPIGAARLREYQALRQPPFAQQLRALGSQPLRPGAPA